MNDPRSRERIIAHLNAAGLTKARLIVEGLWPAASPRPPAPPDAGDTLTWIERNEPGGIALVARALAACPLPRARPPAPDLAHFDGCPVCLKGGADPYDCRHWSHDAREIALRLDAAESRASSAERALGEARAVLREVGFDRDGACRDCGEGYIRGDGQVVGCLDCCLLARALAPESPGTATPHAHNCASVIGGKSACDCPGGAPESPGSADDGTGTEGAGA
jgi:hypothetical protein